MSRRKYDPKLADDITAVAGHLTGEVEFLRQVLEIVWRTSLDGRESGNAVDQHFALKEIEATCVQALERTASSQQGGAK